MAAFEFLSLCESGSGWREIRESELEFEVLLFCEVVFAVAADPSLGFEFAL